jgi:alpha-D-xyloside xylohydrolase
VRSRPSDPRGVERAGAAFAAAPDEAVFGLGEQFGAVNQRGRTVVAWARDIRLDDGPGTYKPVPFFLSSRGYGLLVQSFARPVFDLAATRSDAHAVQVEEPTSSSSF